jgi:CRISPR/Cas system endoribonuclease Cas6 (RAMP superfamily)
MKLGGVVGRLVLEGDLAPFVPLLRTAEIVHVGKGATFGLGKLAVEPAC